MKIVKTRNGIGEINKVCKAVLKLTDADFTEVEKMYEEQASYCHPLKMAKASKQHELGSHNQRVVEALKALRSTIQGSPAADLRGELERYKQWVNDLQSGMYVNCIYCGHRYGPEDKVPSSMADVLKQHIEQCPEHPMSKLKAELEQLREENSQL